MARGRKSSIFRKKQEEINNTRLAEEQCAPWLNEEVDLSLDFEDMDFQNMDGQLELTFDDRGYLLYPYRWTTNAGYYMYPDTETDLVEILDFVPIAHSDDDFPFTEASDETIWAGEDY